MSESPGVSRRQAHYALFLLVVVYVFNFVDRNVMTILVEPIKTELGLADWQMGVLLGPAFGFLYIFAGLPLGRLMIGYMGVTETGAAVLPPFVSHVSWRTVALADGLLALTFIATIAVLVLLYQRLAVHRALRMGEL